MSRDPVSVLHFGRDHYSTLLYVESVCVDSGGRPQIERMRCDRKRHPQWAHLPVGFGGKSPTRLADGSELQDHDDWDCVEDMIAAGWIEVAGWTERLGLRVPAWELTASGWGAAHNERRARAERSKKARA